MTDPITGRGVSEGNNVTQFPPPPDPPPLLIGPFQTYHVVVDGRIIPRLTGWTKGDKTWLCVDRRFGGGFSTEEDARQAAYLIANAMAVAEGYAWVGAENKDRCFAPKSMQIDTMPEPGK